MLTQKQETFCIKYFELGNASEAALMAKYSPKTAAYIGSENLEKPQIQARIRELRQKVEDKAIANVQERQKILTQIARTNTEDLLEISEDGRDTQIKREALSSPAVASIRTQQVALGRMPVRITRVSMIDKTKAIDILNKMDKTYTEGGNTYNINIDKMVVDARGKLQDALCRLAARAGESLLPEQTNE